MIIESSADVIAQRLLDLAGKIQVKSLDALEKMAKGVQTDMQQDGSPIVYPVQWDSDKQKRAFFATNGFGKGIPTGRTGKYQQGWVLTQVENGWELANPHPAGAIGGTVSGWQSNIHVGRWPNIIDVVMKNMGLLQEELGNANQSI